MHNGQLIVVALTYVVMDIVENSNLVAFCITVHTDSVFEEN